MIANARPIQILAWSTQDPRYDGQWSPHTHDACDELALLIPQLEAHTQQRVTRVTLNMNEWSGNQPRRLVLSGHLLRIGWFPRLPAATATFGSHRQPRVVLSIERTGTSRAPDATRRGADGCVSGIT